VTGGRAGWPHPRAALVIPSASRRGGGDVWLAELLAHPHVHGSLDLVAVFETGGELAELAEKCGHRVAVLGRRHSPSSQDFARLAVRLSRVLRRERPQVTLHWSPRAHIYGTLARQLTGSLGVAGWVQHVMPSRFWLHRLASGLPADAVVCVSSAVARRQRQLYPRRRALIVQPGVDITRPDIDRRSARRTLNLPEIGPVIGVVGRVEPWKGQDVLVRAYGLLRKRGLPEARLLCVGYTRSRTWPEFSG
jgi:glycosyltransferase involved in cell wall biosynthesis